ncbi:MAG: MATE family efflux transporter [Psychroflexus sp.]|nr:MATE family efflux transporter [Psychroflexus sp.]
MAKDATSAITFSNINRLAIPAIIAGIAEPLISLADVAIIGNVSYDSVPAQGAVGIVGSFLSALIWILAQTKTAISAYVSQSFGAKRMISIKTLVPQLLLFNLMLSLVLYVVTSLTANYIFEAYNASGQLLEYSISYYRIRALGFPLTLLTFAIFGVFRGMQNTYWAMKCSLIGAAVNIGFNFLLVFGIEGLFEGLHIIGAAYASLLAQLTMFLMAIWFYIKKTPFVFKVKRKINPKMKDVLIMSGNLFIRTASLNVAIYMANAYATDYGKNFIAAQSILMNIWLFFSFFIDGYANAGNAMGGRLLGEKNYLDLWRLSKKISFYAIIIALGLGIICVLLYSQIGMLFNKDADVLRIFKDMFWIVLLMQPINALAFIYDGIFKGLGEAKYLRNLLVVATFGGFVPTLLLADHFGLQLYSVWIAFGVWMIIRSFTLVFKFRSKYLSKAI